MVRCIKALLAISCLIALGVIVYRLYAKFEINTHGTPKTKVYSFSLDQNAVIIKKGNVKWDSNSQVTGDVVQDNSINQVDVNQNVHTTQKVKIIAKMPTTYGTTKKLTTVKATTHKITEKIVKLPPLTKATTKRVNLVTTPKSIEPVRSHGMPLCSSEGEKLGKGLE